MIMRLTGSAKTGNGLLLMGMLLLPVWGPAVHADPLHAWRAGEHAAAVAAWRVQAKQGDAEAALYLGHVHRRGLGVAADDARAAAWYRRAAELGLAEAQYELAMMYELGLGVARDPAEAARWYALSSAQACPSELSAGDLLGD